MQSFENKVAVITGGASGMGRYLAVLLAKMGCNVAICDINEDELSKTASMLSQYNVASSQHVVDIGDKTQIDQFYEDVLARHQKVDLVFNNAGITVVSDFDSMPETDWDRVMSKSRGCDQHESEIPSRAQITTRGRSDQHLFYFWNGSSANSKRLPRHQVCSPRVY